ncbi:MAG: FAD-dependent oxidoreductase [Acidobacteriota bacterium]
MGNNGSHKDKAAETRDRPAAEPAEVDAGRLSRRSVLKGAAALLPAGALAGIGACSRPRGEPAGSGVARGGSHHVAVVGAGAFGGWTALHLLRKGARVTLMDTWGPGNSRASSGGETRVIRHTYGPDRIYVDWVNRALQLWRQNGERWHRQLYHQTGVLWMVQEYEDYERSALPNLTAAGVDYEQFSADGVAHRYPQINPEGIRWAIYEKDAGYLFARRACEAVLEGFLAEGGEFRKARVEPGAFRGGELEGIRLSDGDTLTADRYVFACGPWLGGLFPEVLGDLILPTRQEVFYFGTRPGDSQYGEGAFPVWADHGERLWYGIPGAERRGFKVADDSLGGEIDPTTAEREPSDEGLRRARNYMEFRFPGMKGAPLLEARVCQYENSPDGHFIIDRHPEAENLWLVGGGSGHGFKHGPALGEHVAERVLGEKPLEPFFALDRFSA